jgi:hypothetical protein
MRLLRLTAIALRAASAFRREPERTELRRLSEELAALRRGDATPARAYPAAPSSR